MSWFFLFKQKTAYELRISDWSSDVCSSDLMGADPDIYLARVHWSADGDTLYVERENRDQTRLDMLVVDPATGTSRVLFSEKSGPKSWINLSNSFHAMADGSLIWWSERSGHGHLRSEEHTSELQSLMRISYAV